MMPTYTLMLADLVAITVLVFGLFLPRHRRPELVVAVLTANVGVLAVSVALSSSTIGAGLGLGLFGILSIIRLRSQELAQNEIAYYFAALALGVLGGLDRAPSWQDLGLMAAVVGAVAIGDSRLLRQRSVAELVLLDHAYPDRLAMITELQARFGMTVLSATVQRMDLVNDTTLVDVRFAPTRLGRDAAGADHDVAAVMPTRELLR